MIEANIEGGSVNVGTIEVAKYSFQNAKSLLPSLNEESPRIPEAFKGHICRINLQLSERDPLLLSVR
jgi:hypothetical protein